MNSAKIKISAICEHKPDTMYMVGKQNFLSWIQQT